MACQHLYSHGWQNQDNFQRCRRDRSYRMASQGIWLIQLPDGDPCVTMLVMGTAKSIHTLESRRRKKDNIEYETFASLLPRGVMN